MDRSTRYVQPNLVKSGYPFSGKPGTSQASQGSVKGYPAATRSVNGISTPISTTPAGSYVPPMSTPSSGVSVRPHSSTTQSTVGYPSATSKSVRNAPQSMIQPTSTTQSRIQKPSNDPTRLKSTAGGQQPSNDPTRLKSTAEPISPRFAHDMNKSPRSQALESTRQSLNKLRGQSAQMKTKTLPPSDPSSRLNALLSDECKITGALPQTSVSQIETKATTIPAREGSAVTVVPGGSPVPPIGMPKFNPASAVIATAKEPSTPISPPRARTPDTSARSQNLSPRTLTPRTEPPHSQSPRFQQPQNPSVQQIPKRTSTAPPAPQPAPQIQRQTSNSPRPPPSNINQKLWENHKLSGLRENQKQSPRFVNNQVPSQYQSSGQNQSVKNQSVKICEWPISDEDSLETAIAICLAIATSKMPPEKQRDMLERALSIFERSGGPDHPQFAITLANLGDVYGALGNVEKKRELLERALSAEETKHGPDHPELAVTLTNLGIAYGELRNRRKKQALLQRALSISEKKYGKDHLNNAMLLANLAVAHGELGDFGHMAGLLERALSIEEKAYGKEDLEVARTLVDLGNAYGLLGYEAKKTGRLQNAIRILEQKADPWVANVRSMLLQSEPVVCM